MTSIGPAATAAEAVAMVVDRLPPTAGSVFVGTREQFAAYQAELGIQDPPAADESGIHGSGEE